LIKNKKKGGDGWEEKIGDKRRSWVRVEMLVKYLT